MAGLAVFPMPSRSLTISGLSETPLVIVAESVEKPGNLGAILRTADAAAVDASAGLRSTRRPV